MTTRVTINNAEGHNNVLVQVEQQMITGAWERVGTSVVVRGGKEHAEYVYDGRRIIVIELKK